jgi:hypothetical protein
MCVCRQTRTPAREHLLTPARRFPHYSVVYDPTSGRNEEESADLFLAFAAEAASTNVRALCLAMMTTICTTHARAA